MDAHCSDGSAPVRSDGITRRDIVLRTGGGSLAMLLLTQGAERAAAQDATPATGSLPPGVGFFPLIGIPVPDVPTGPFTLNLTRLTLVSGASAPESSVPYLEIVYTESGTLICPGGDGRWIYAPDGTVTASGPGDLVVPAGSAFYGAPNAVDGARNDGSEPVAALIIDFVPNGEMATPMA